MNTTAFMTEVAVTAAILGAAWGAMVTRDVMRGQRWMAASRAGVGSASLLNLVTIGNGSWLVHQLIAVVGVALLIASVAAYWFARREKQRDVRGFLQ